MIFERSGRRLEVTTAPELDLVALRTDPVSYRLLTILLGRLGTYFILVTVPELFVIA